MNYEQQSKVLWKNKKSIKDWKELQIGAFFQTMVRADFSDKALFEQSPILSEGLESISSFSVPLNPI